MNKKKLLLATAALLFTSCTHIKIDTPVAYIQPSELLSDGGFSFGLHLKPTREHTVTNDASERPLVFVNNNEQYNQISGDFSFGMDEDFQATLGLTELFGVITRIQYQLIGAPREKATVGLSAALNAELGFDTSSKNGDQSSTFGPGGYKWTSRSTMTNVGGGVSVGYRTSNKFMTFAGANFNKFQSRTTIDQDPGVSNAGGNYEQKNDGNSKAVGIGFVLGSGGARLIPVAQWTEYNIDLRDSIKGIWCGLTLVMGD